VGAAEGVRAANFLCAGNYAISGGLAGCDAAERLAKSFKARAAPRPPRRRAAPAGAAAETPPSCTLPAASDWAAQRTLKHLLRCCCQCLPPGHAPGARRARVGRDLNRARCCHGQPCAHCMQEGRQYVRSGRAAAARSARQTCVPAAPARC